MAKLMKTKAWTPSKQQKTGDFKKYYDIKSYEKRYSTRSVA